MRGARLAAMIVLVAVVFLVAALMTWLSHRHDNQFGPIGHLLGRPHVARTYSARAAQRRATAVVNACSAGRPKPITNAGPRS
jgi:hypothetical protein